VFLPLLWTFLAMAVILGIALTVVFLVAYPHRDELPVRLWLDDRRG
jgi:hypothetical protein